MNKFGTEFLTSNSTKYRLLRTIAQGILAVIVANLDMLVSYLSIPPELKAMIVALVMAVLSPIMAKLGESLQETQRINELVSAAVTEPEGSWSEVYFTPEEIAKYRTEAIVRYDREDEDV